MLDLVHGRHESAVALMRLRLAEHVPGYGRWGLWHGIFFCSRMAAACGEVALLDEGLARLVREHIPAGAPVVVAGDFNDWNEKLDAILTDAGLQRALDPQDQSRTATFPSLVPVLALDRVYTRGLRCVSVMVPRGAAWARLSDHLPLVVELERAG